MSDTQNLGAAVTPRERAAQPEHDPHGLTPAGSDHEGSGGDVREPPTDVAARDGSPDPPTKSRRRPVRPSDHGDMPDGASERSDPRVQRTVRLSREIDAMIRALAQHRGIDLNAAVSVAIAGDFDRVFGPPPRPPELGRP